MSVRLKVFLIITGIVIIITASSILISISSAQNQILKTLESDMDLVASLANEYFTGEIDLLKLNASNVAQLLKSVNVWGMQPILIEQVAAQEDFSTITILNESGGIEAFYGSSPAPESFAASQYGLDAFGGRQVISSTSIDASGQTVFYVAVPMDDYNLQSILGTRDMNPKIVVCTVPGNFFSQRVNRFLIWETGNIMIQDGEGTIIANVLQEWVDARLNFITLAEKDPKHYTDAARISEKMIHGYVGTDRFLLNNVDAVIAIRPVSSSEYGWSIGVIAPIHESPFYKVQILILVSGAIFLGLGLIAAAFASGFIAKPFYQIRKQNVELIKLGEAAKTAAKAKSEFLSNMSKDMTTPLNTILGLSEMSLKKEGLQKDVGICLEKIFHAGSTLLDVVNNLLDISTMESDKFELTPHEYSVTRCINDLGKANMLHIGNKPITFNLILGDNIPTRLIGDELRVKQIFNNLLSNAFIYTAVGTVDWKISAEKDGDSIWLTSVITDTGPGIKQEDMEKLFMDYNNLKTRKDFSKEGAGLGLALTKRMVELMNGTISAESIFGKGSAFTVKIQQKFVNNAVINAEAAENLKKFSYNQG